jgi:hypothetical protein
MGALANPQRWRAVPSSGWLGLLLCVASISTPAAFANLPNADAGRVAGSILAREAAVSLILGMTLAVLERQIARHAARQFSAGLALALGTVLCTVLGYYVVQPQMAEARLGHGSLSFGQLHAISLAFFVVKGLCVVALAWRASGAVNAR